MCSMRMNVSVSVIESDLSSHLMLTNSISFTYYFLGHNNLMFRSFVARAWLFCSLSANRFDGDAHERLMVGYSDVRYALVTTPSNEHDGFDLMY